tara:strand:- start:318 stop:680 length:363 start_codon:yes stop_codon:yes gene_type:complete
MNKKTNTSNPAGIGKSTNMSYHEYLKAGFNIFSPHLSVRSYKCAPKEEYPIFERGRDIRVKFFWKKDEIYEFITEQSFFFQRNTNKEDREYMRTWADIKLQKVKDAIERGKESSKSNAKT